MERRWVLVASRDLDDRTGLVVSDDGADEEFLVEIRGGGGKCSIGYGLGSIQRMGTAVLLRLAR